MRRFLTGMIVMLFIILAVTSGVFGYLFFTNQAATNTAKQEKLSAELQVTALEQTVSELGKSRTLSDAKLGMTATYPIDWVVALNTDITTKFATEGNVTGPILGAYGWSFTKAEAKLTINKILGGVGGHGVYLDPAQFDFKVLKSDKGDVVRYAAKGKDVWSYVTIGECDASFTEAASKPDAICTGILFGKSDDTTFPTQVTLKGTTADTLLAEADKIVQSVQK